MDYNFFIILIKMELFLITTMVNSSNYTEWIISIPSAMTVKIMLQSKIFVSDCKL